MPKNLKHVIKIGFLFLLSGCASLSTLQTARALSAGEYQVQLGALIFQGRKYDIAEIHFPSGPVYVGGGGRLGLGKKWEMGGSIGLSGLLSLGVKRELMSIQSTAIATGLQISLNHAVPKSLSSNARLGSSLIVPFILSYDLGEQVSLYGAPKAVWFLGGDQVSTQTHGLYFGTDVGVRIGRRWGAFLELDYFKGDFQLAVALCFGCVGVQSDG